MAVGLTLGLVAAASAVAFLLCGIFFLISLAYLYLRGVTGADTKCFSLHGEDLELGDRDGQTDDATPVSKEAEVRRYTKEEVKALLATAAVIGEGGFSTVYLAGRRLSGFSLAAVKVYAGCGELPRRAFRQELDVLRRLRHPRIVRLLGYSEDGEGGGGGGGGVLVLEYVPNGTLYEKLHGGGSSSLPWSARMRIAYEVAGAVEYLHGGGGGGYSLPIVHGDLTAANVLLDADLCPKICDFGSARVGFSSALRSAGPVVGSPGYTDPHYLRTGIASKKTDVYSFGVILLELLTGRPASGAEGGRMPLGAEMAGGGAAEAVDPSMREEHDAAEAAAMAAIAAACVGERPTLRPSMAEIRSAMREKVGSSVAALDGKSNGQPKLHEKKNVTEATESN